jgi:hypothetical protein
VEHELIAILNRITGAGTGAGGDTWGAANEPGGHGAHHDSSGATEVGPVRRCSPRRRMPFFSTSDGSECAGCEAGRRRVTIACRPRLYPIDGVGHDVLRGLYDPAASIEGPM